MISPDTSDDIFTSISGCTLPVADTFSVIAVAVIAEVSTTVPSLPLAKFLATNIPIANTAKTITRMIIMIFFLDILI